MNSPEGLSAPLPAQERIEARISELEALGYGFEASLATPLADTLLQSQAFYGSDVIVHTVPPDIEDTLERYDYLMCQLKAAKGGDFDVIYLLDAGLPSLNELKDGAASSNELPNPRKLQYKPGHVSFVSRKL